MPTLNAAAARAPTSALPPRAGGPTPDGLTAIPRSEAMTLDRVPQLKPTPPPSTIPPVGSARPGPRPTLSLPAPGPEARPSAAPSRKQTTADIRGRPAAELSIETAAEQLDHKGRSKPIFAPRTPRPTARRIHPALDFAAGLFPGVRLMAKDRVASGLAYAIVGVVALLPAVMVLLGWSERSTTVERLLVHRAWIAGHFGVVVASALVFEVVRCLSAIEPARRHVQLARVIAALGLPAALVVVGAPFVMSDAPSIVEPLWFLALPTALLAAIAGIDVVTRPEPSAHHRPALVAASAALASVLVVALVLVMSVETRDGLARRATDAGFARLPGLIRALHVGS